MSARAWLRLAFAADVGPVMAHRLLAAFGSPEAIFAAPREALARTPGLGPSRLGGLLDPAADARATAEIAHAEASGVRIVGLGDPEYPELLRRMAHPPLVLWVRGRLDARDRLALAIVGPRKPSPYGRLMTERIVGPLAADGLTIVSGLAYGIDAAAHKAALDTGGRTLAVLGQGLGTRIYPQTNARLAECILAEDRGALISVFPLATEPSSPNFPLRNEVIAGISMGSLVIEASPESGALITAQHAAAAGRPVLACPGDANRRNALGSNKLIAEGAALIQDAGDALAALRTELREGLAELGEAESATPERPRPARPEPAAADLDPLVADLLDLLADEPLPVDALSARMAERGHAPGAVMERLLLLEMDGHIRQQPGRIYARTAAAPARADEDLD